MDLCIRNRKLIFILSLLLVAAVSFLVFHNHPDGDHLDCPVCRLIQLLVILFVPILTLIPVSLNRIFSAVPIKKLSSLLLPENIQGRAPPVFA